MQDRVPLYPGRVKLTPVSGQTNVYEMTRADQPTQEGTPLNKATLLQDATAALFGLGTDAVPDDMLNALAHTGDLHVWKRTQNGAVDYPVSPNPDAYQVGDNAQPAGYALGDIQSGSFKLAGRNVSGAPQVDSYSSISVDDYGNASTKDLVGSITDSNLVNSATAAVAQTIFPGNFFIVGGSDGYGSTYFKRGKVYYAPADAVLEFHATSGNSTNYITISKYQEVTGYASIPADTSIEYLGQLGDKLRIVTGSYIGTGKFGTSNPNTIEAGGKIKLLVISGKAGNNSCISVVVPYGVPNITEGDADAGYADLTLTWTDTGVSWYYQTFGPNGAPLQMNITGETYRYVAIL